MASKLCTILLARVTIVMIAATLAALFPEAASSAESDTGSSNISCEVPQILFVEYTGGDVTFELGCEDFHRGYAEIEDQGDVNWEANCAPWMIRTQRTEWERECDDDDGDDEDDWDPSYETIHLQVKYGPPGGSEWDDVTTSIEDWIGGSSAGEGSFEHIDWKVKDIGWDHHRHHHHYGPPPPGTYTCTVTFTIEYRGS